MPMRLVTPRSNKLLIRWRLLRGITPENFLRLSRADRVPYEVRLAHTEVEPGTIDIQTVTSRQLAQWMPPPDPAVPDGIWMDVGVIGPNAGVERYNTETGNLEDNDICVTDAVVAWREPSGEILQEHPDDVEMTRDGQARIVAVARKRR